MSPGTRSRLPPPEADTDVRRVSAFPLALILSTGVALALSGSVVDELGAPVEGARVCYFVVNTESLCAATDAGGAFQLLDSQLETIRIAGDGFLPLVSPAAPQEAPFVLRRAAELWVRLTASSGARRLESGEVFLVLAGGILEGPFPASPGGVVIRSLKPGKARVVAAAEGYVPKTVIVELQAGERLQQVIDLDRRSSAESRGN